MGTQAKLIMRIVQTGDAEPFGEVCKRSREMLEGYFKLPSMTESISGVIIHNPYNMLRLTELNLVMLKQ